MQGQVISIGRYQVRGALDNGGFATVYHAYDPVLDRDVALKVLHPHLAREADTRDRFVREGRALARVHHPNMVQVFDAGEWDGTAYLAMELVAGRSLNALLREGGRPSSAEVVEVTRQVAAGLAAIHDRKLVHRDVKPGNILVEPDTGRAVLLDLGAAGSLDASTVTSAHWLVGTPGYMAPEQLEPDGSVTLQTDVYQLAATVYALLAGQPPFTGTSTQVMYAVVHHPPPDLCVLRPDLPAAVADAVRQGLAKDPSRRPPSALAFAANLQAAATSAAPPTPLPPMPATDEPTRIIERPRPAEWADTGDHSPATAVTSARDLPTSTPVPADRRHRRTHPVGRGAILLAVLAGVAMLIGGALTLGVLMAGGGNGDAGRGELAGTTAMLETTATQAPAPTAETAPSPSPAPFPSPTPAPAATPEATPTPATTPPRVAVPAENAVAALRVAMEGRGYVPASDAALTPATETGGVLAAQRGVRADCGSDNFCQFVFFTWDGRFLDTDTASPSRVILSVRPAGTGRISVTYEGYTRDDPRGAPSGPPVTITYTCDATRCTPDRWPPPGHAP